jgi:hypothetical protein
MGCGLSRRQNAVTPAASSLQGTGLSSDKTKICSKVHSKIMGSNGQGLPSPNTVTELMSIVLRGSHEVQATNTPTVAMAEIFEALAPTPQTTPEFLGAIVKDSLHEVHSHRVGSQLFEQQSLKFANKTKACSNALLCRNSWKPKTFEGPR